jgi:hypothetical protein
MEAMKGNGLADLFIVCAVLIFGLGGAMTVAAMLAQ